MGFTGAYLNGELKEELYMDQPTGFEDGTDGVCRLWKSIYGLKQVGNVWYDEFNRLMSELGYKHLCSD